MHKEAIEKVMDSKVGQEPGVRRACQVLLGVRAGSQREALRVVQEANLAMGIARKPTRADAPTEKAEAEKAPKAPKKEAAPKAAAPKAAPPAKPEPAPKKRAKPATKAD